MARSGTEKVLRAYLALRSASRAEVARKTGLSLPTVSEVTEALVAHGLLQPGEEVVSSRGRPALLLGVRAGRLSIAAVDIDDSGLVSAVITDLAGETYATGRFHARQVPAQRLFEQLRAWLAEHASKVPPLASLVIGAPGIVYPDQQLVRTAVHLGWRDLEIGALMKGMDAPILVSSRALFYALAEARRPRPTPLREALCLWIGSAIGGAVIRNGQVAERPRAHHPEFGHIVVRVSGKRCTCGSRGCLEVEYFSAKARSSDQAIAVLSAGITSLVNLYAPEVVVLGGPEISADPDEVARVRATVATHALPVSAQPVEIRVSTAGEHPQLVGALIRAREMAASILSEQIDAAAAARRKGIARMGG